MNSILHERRYLIPFRSLLLPHIFCDTLVIGSGVAGLRAAIAAAEHGDVILVTKSEPGRSSTSWAQGGVAAVLDSDPESLDSHLSDTLDAGCALSDPEIARIAVESAAERIAELESWGMRFDREASGRPALGLEGGHHRARILHSDGDATGAELSRCLLQRVEGDRRIRLFDNCFALDLLTPTESPGAPVLGAVTHHPRYGLQIIWAWATILATGGLSNVYRESTNPAVVTGDGAAMAYRAGATLADMAFVQFHPTTLYVAGAPRHLITEAVRGEGARLVDRRGERFMEGRHEMADLAPRDVVSRSIVEHLAETGDTHVFLDATMFPPGRFAQRFPGIYGRLAEFGIDPQTDLIPVHPAAHYSIGGVWTDADGRTAAPGLYAVGEVACNGLHGANRLASNSLLDGLVFGERAGRVCVEAREQKNSGLPEPPGPKKIISDIPISTRGELDLADVRSSLRSVMWRHVGISRSGDEMEDVREMIDFWARYTLDKIFDEPAGWETQNMLSLASLICESARFRRESRGTHFRSDFPDLDDRYLGHDMQSRHEPAVTLTSAVSHA